MEDILASKETSSRIGRPVLESRHRKNSYLGFRTNVAQMDLLELASRLCGFKSRGSWAISRLMLLAHSVVRQAGIDPSDARAVHEYLEEISSDD